MHFWEHEHDPKYIFYFGQSKNFEEWYNKIKDQSPIYKEIEDKSTFTKRIFEDEVKNFDKYSILKFDDNIDIEFESIKNKKNDLNDDIENLSQKIHDNIDNDEIEKKIKEFEEIEIRKF
jgi:hypothetical protein